MRALVVAGFVLTFVAMTCARQGEEQDYFLPPPCGGTQPDEPKPTSTGQVEELTPLLVTEQTLSHHRVQGLMPMYPGSARRARIEGVVALLVIVDKEGNVAKVDTLEGSPALVQATTKAVRQWKYRPMVLDGSPFSMAGKVVVTFRLNTKPFVVDGGQTHLPERACIGGGPLYVRKVIPEYPSAAKVAHVQGDVVVNIRLDSSGTVNEAKVISGHPLLVGAALAAVKRWVFQPYVVQGIPVPTEIEVTVNFHM